MLDSLPPDPISGRTRSNKRNKWRPTESTELNIYSVSFHLQFLLILTTQLHNYIYLVWIHPSYIVSFEQLCWICPELTYAHSLSILCSQLPEALVFLTCFPFACLHASFTPAFPFPSVFAPLLPICMYLVGPLLFLHCCSHLWHFSQVCEAPLHQNLPTAAASITSCYISWVVAVALLLLSFSIHILCCWLPKSYPVA